MEFQFFKTKMGERRGRFGCVALAPIQREQKIPDFPDSAVLIIFLAPVLGLGV